MLSDSLLIANDDDDNTSSSAAVNAVEDIVLHFLTQLHANSRHDPDESDDETAQEMYKKPKIVLELADRTKSKSLDGSIPSKRITYPKKSSKGSAKPFAQIFRVLQIVFEASVDEFPATKRDIYYQDVPLFQNQRTVDCFVDDLAATFKLGRADLNVRASPKGLVCGSGLSILLKSNETVDVKDAEACMIPLREDVHRYAVAEDIKWVIIVEKEAVFQTLCKLSSTRHPLLPGRGVLITGKGYPDMATRQLVKSLAEVLPASVPILALVDSDPYGIDILSVYKYGSRALSHETQNLAEPRVRWIGVWSTDLPQFDIDEDLMITITSGDRKKARSMLQRTRSTLPKQWREELERMLDTGRKAEIEILASSRAPRNCPPLLSYLIQKLPSFCEITSLKPSSAEIANQSTQSLIGVGVNIVA